jgi:hypothetical protein
LALLLLPEFVDALIVDADAHSQMGYPVSTIEDDALKLSREHWMEDPDTDLYFHTPGIP